VPLSDPPHALVPEPEEESGAIRRGPSRTLVAIVVAASIAVIALAVMRRKTPEAIVTAPSVTVAPSASARPVVPQAPPPTPEPVATDATASVPTPVSVDAPAAASSTPKPQVQRRPVAPRPTPTPKRFDPTRI
jgi:hypothetical protein